VAGWSVVGCLWASVPCMGMRGMRAWACAHHVCVLAHRFGYMAFLDDGCFLYHLYASMPDTLSVCVLQSVSSCAQHTASVSGTCIKTCMQHTRRHTSSTCASSTGTPLLSSVSTYHTHTHTHTHTRSLGARQSDEITFADTRSKKTEASS